jgi:sterol desaturase/sphingolipid hydroxylase (fatty acid hydroxylase superfamily)
MTLFEEIFEHFFDPKKRVFIGYLLISIGLAIGWLVYFRKSPLKKAVAKIFDAKILFSRSARADYKIFLVNRVLMIFISPYLLSQMVIATSIYYFLHTLPSLNVVYLKEVPTYIITIAFTFTFFIFDDFTKYWIHRVMHKWPILWALHKVHHSAETLNPMTVYRTHPLEGIVFSLRGAVSQGIVISFFIFAFGNKVDLVTIIGVNIFVFASHIAGSNLRHSHIGIQYWAWVEKIVISPAQHQLHHSLDLRHYDKNFGATLAIWDWVFGSLHHSEDVDTLTLGIEDESLDQQTLKELYIYPLKEIGNILLDSLNRLKSIFRLFRI